MDVALRSRSRGYPAFAYNSNGDRLWQEVNGSRTNFTLDLNTALTQVLAQSGGGMTTYL